MSERKWKIGDWAEYVGTRCLVIDVFSSGAVVIVKRADGVWLDGCDDLLRSPSGDHTELRHLPDCTGWDWQPPRPEPQYRQFANAEEYAPHRDRWVKDKYDGELVAVVRIWPSGSGISTCDQTISFRDAFNRYTFDDGTPFGVEVQS